VQLSGPVYGPAKWDLLRRADVLALPSRTENFGIVVAEALACGVPVLTTTGTPWRELVSHDCGWWVDFGAAPLAEGLRRATELSRPELEAMGARGRRLIAERYTWSGVAAQFVEVYRRLASSP